MSWLMARRNWKCEKTITYPLVSEAWDWKKDVSNGYQYLELQYIWSTPKCNAKQKWQTHVGLNFQAKSISINYSKSNPKGSKWGPKSILETSWEANLKRRRFLMPRGRLKDLFWGTIWEAKIVPNTFQKRFQDAYDIGKNFGTVLEPFRDWFWTLFWSLGVTRS